MSAGINTPTNSQVLPRIGKPKQPLKFERACPRAEKTLGANPEATRVTAEAEIPGQERGRALAASLKVILTCKLMRLQNQSLLAGNARLRPVSPGDARAAWEKRRRRAVEGLRGTAAARPGERVSDTVRRLPADARCQAPVSKTHSTGLWEAFIRPSSQLITERVIAAPPLEAFGENKACFCPAPACRLVEENLKPACGHPASASPARASPAGASPARASPSRSLRRLPHGVNAAACAPTRTDLPSLS